MAEPTIQKITIGGIEPAYETLDTSTYILNRHGTLFLHIKNTNSGQTLVTIESLVPCNQGANHNVVVAIPSNEERMIGPFPPARFNPQVGDAQDNKLVLTWIGTNGGAVTVAALEVGP